MIPQSTRSRRSVLRRTAVVWVASLAPLPTLVETALADTPNYDGAVCVIDHASVRILIETDASVTNVLVYPDPPGGGWYLDRTEPGRFERVFKSPDFASGSIDVRFILQNPTQYSFPTHTLQLTDGCTTFRRDDVTPPPARGFRHDLISLDDHLRIEFQASPGDGNVPETEAVSLRYRLDEGTIESRSMDRIGPLGYSIALDGVGVESSIEYWFEQRIGIRTVESALFHRIVGEPAVPVTLPVVARTAGRFRDRHPNEWRFDHYVEGYDGGKIFEIEIMDFGDRLDLTVTTDDTTGPERIDVGYFIQSGAAEMCDRPLPVNNLVMVPDPSRPHVFSQTISDVNPGQIVEFDLTHIGVPNPAGGTFQYYTEFFHYRVGSGWFGTSRSNPRAHAAGHASIDLITAPRFAFTQHATNLTLEELGRFMEGKTRFETDHADGELLNFATTFGCCTENGTDVFPASPHARVDALGPRFNQTSCIGCHMMDGRGATPTGLEDNLTSLVLQFSLGRNDVTGGPTPHPDYGSQLDTHATSGTAPEGRLTVEYETVVGFFDDGTPYELRRPRYTVHDTLHGSPGVNFPDADGRPGHPGLVQTSARIAPILAGTGLLEAIDESAILELEDPQDRDGDGISGRVNWVHDLATDRIAMGRFGWKASQPGLVQQTAVAYQRDLGLTSPLTPNHDCGEADPSCESSAPELSTGDIQLVADYVQGLTLPPRRNHEDPLAIEGMHLFKRANCQACHVPTLRTRADHELAAFRDVVVQPFTDLLLHDMGQELADGLEDHLASGREWRTPPLWGAGYVGFAQGRPERCDDPYAATPTPNYLHDGRARTLMEAILWHGGEADASRRAVLAMTEDERTALLAYLAFPFADPALDPPDNDLCPADLDGDGRVDGADLARILQAWGGPGVGDIDGDGIVDSADLGRLLVAWGSCPAGE